MLSLFTKAVALLASIQSVAGSPVRESQQVIDVARRANGPVNAVYFTNW